VQGHRLARNAMGDRITSVFITPPTLSELERRLRDRSTDSDEVIAHRLHNAREEIQALDEFDYVLINERIEETVEQFVALAHVARLKMDREARQRLIAAWG
jgi:guanylate kinase